MSITLIVLKCSRCDKIQEYSGKDVSVMELSRQQHRDGWRVRFRNDKKIALCPVCDANDLATFGSPKGKKA